MTRRHRGYSMVEVIVAIAILVIGIVGVLQFFPPSLRASSEAALRGHAALLAQRKMEEIRRDDNQSFDLINSIRTLEEPTEPIPFPEDDRLVYQFHSRSLLADDEMSGNVEDMPGTPRVIVRYNTQYRTSGDILVELRFDSPPVP
ncbi:MAG: prepilin-type N-terminal cleavage/methylation domain-containing protein [Candidatus Sumerlaeia bacterium]|nr:prepilin-type N-terminal cleavage/methylation domain-containing protein [Candidatus Sumerlaeia bacterium]